jgi:hypothetical protein
MVIRTTYRERAGCGTLGEAMRPADDGRRICQVPDPFGTVWGLEETAD